LFGGVRVTDTAGRTVDIGAAKCRAVLACLALSADKPVTVGRLVDCVWGGNPPPKADKTLQSYVSLLRSALEDLGVVIRRVDAACVLELDPAAVDVLRFEQALDNGDVEEALTEWTDRPLVGLDAAGLDPVVAGLVERWQSALHDHLADQIDHGRARETIGRLTELTAEFPLRESWWALLMTALYKVGRQADALAAYAEARRRLVDDLGVEPGPGRRQLEAEILRQDGTIQARRRPPQPETLDAGTAATGRTAGPGNLPVQATSFVGRAAEVEELLELVQIHRMVTLTGVGGIGKTRLALRVAAELTGRFPDGVWLVELAPVGESAAVPDAVATALGITPRSGMSVAASVAQALSVRRLLVVLDNCEHVLDAAAHVAETILAAASTVNILATSREGLQIGAEHLWPVPPLDVGTGTGSTAVELFAQRARAVNPRFAIETDAEATAVSDICTRLDGIALAIELAAARMVSMTPAEVRDRLGDRFRLLSSARRGLERHQTLGHAVAWSYDLLDPEEQALFVRCAVFADGFTLDAAAHVCGDGRDLDEYRVLDLLDSLVRKSLVTTEQVLGRTRYGMLETIRQFAHDQLTAAGILDEVRRSHAIYFAEQSVIYWDRWDGPNQRDSLEWVDAEFGNLRAGFRWASDHGDLATATAIAAHTTMLAWALQRYESVGWAEQLLEAATEADLPLLPRLYTAASFCVFTDRPETALRYAQTALELETVPDYTPFDPLWATNMMAHAHLFIGRIDRWLEIAAGLADRDGVSRVAGLGMVVFLTPVEQAMTLPQETLDAARRHGNPFFIAAALGAYGRAFTDADPDRALSVFREGRRYTADQRLDYFRAVIARDSAELEANDGEIDKALQLLDTSIDLFHRAGDYASVGSVLAYMAVFFDRFEQPELAATLYGASAAYGTTSWAGNLPDVVDHLRSQLDPATYEKYVATGAAMDTNQAVKYARDQIRTARLQHRSDRPPNPATE